MSKILRFRLFQVVLTAVMLIVVHSRECINSGKRCQLKCCGLSDHMKCRKRCFGIACDSDLDCDKDCCVNSICSSCPLRTTSTTNTDPTTLPQIRKTTSLIIPKPSSGQKIKENVSSPTNNNQTPKAVLPRGRLNENNSTCSNKDKECTSNCCIDGRCVDSGRCVSYEYTPIKLARGGRGGGGRGGGGRGGGGPGAGSSVDWAGINSAWWILIITAIAVVIGCVIICICRWKRK